MFAGASLFKHILVHWHINRVSRPVSNVGTHTFHRLMDIHKENDDAGEPPPPAVDQVGMSVTAANFYRRPLPESCIDFASEQGKKLFKESLLEGYCNIYFKLASQFRTQDEPAYCGLSTLVMVLNALEVDPERVWKAPWRYYHESMLDCCVPLENVKKTGINLVQFSCLAICNRLESRISHGNDSNEFLSQLRREITESVRGESTVVVASYDRAELGQSGSGHFSPLAAYHSATDSVLIMDVARFKYPPHWVPLSVLQKAMCSVDPSSKKPRGYVTLRLQRHTRPLVMFGVKCNLGCNDGDFATSVLSWREFLVCDPLADPAEELSLSCRRFAQCFGPHALCCTQKQIQGEMEKKNRPELAEALSDACRTVCGEVRQTKVAGVFQNGAVAALMLAWPFEPGVSERSDRLLNMTKTELANFSADTKNEISLLSTQLMTLSSCSRPSVRLDRIDSTTSRCSQKNNDCRCKQDVRL